MILLNPKTAGKNGSEIYDVQFNNCGLYKDIPLDISVSRKFGRTDHHFIFVISGRFEFDIGDKTHVAENGDVVYIPPNVPHEYCYKSGEGTLYYWVHFSGLSIDKMFETFPFKHGLYHSAQIDNYIEYLSNILRSHAKNKIGNEFYMNAQTQCMITKLGQEIFDRRALSKREKAVVDIARKIKQDPTADYSNELLAKELDISEFHFIRLFKEETGHSPQKYRNLMLIEKSRQLLVDTTLNINEIAYMLGFSDPLYFSRIFKKYVGISPKEYRVNSQYD